MGFSPSERFRGDNCTACGICSSVCPVSAVITDGPGQVLSFSSLCIGCGHCGCYCPANCFGLPSVDDANNYPSYGVLDTIIKRRRSTRSYTGTQLTCEEIDSLLEPVGYSPTGHNDQGIRITVINGRESIERTVVTPVLRLIRFADCFRLLTLLSGPGKVHLKRLKTGEDLVTWGAPCVLLFSAPLRNVTGNSDAVIAAATVSLKAESMGLGTLWNGVVKILAPFLGLGRCYAAICVGHPMLKQKQSVPGRIWIKKEL